MQDCPRCQRNLVATTGTLPTFGFQFIGTLVPASRTHEAIRPAAGGQILLAGFFVGKLDWNSRKVLETAAEAFPHTTASGLLKQPDKQKPARGGASESQSQVRIVITAQQRRGAARRSP